ncbi:cupin domain-containing protein [Halosolutus gelatinilyticus]|uniref:cupin domain-containing protein n=1 Tax=Halosolutus gelatinilyticus TaxID=2931975 RepID=UPI001FF6B641|nr:cupin domain-containing protein [Halosolutus gelatinilyticus]
MDTVNESDLDWIGYDRDETDGEVEFRRKHLSNAVDATDLGCSLYELPPGSKSWPYHYHAANAEALFVLSGSGLLRVADGEKPIEAGDFAVFSAGERGGHRIVSDGEEPLRYLMVSTMNDPDVTVYPETEKFGVYVGSPPGGRDERSLEGYYRIDDDVDYWD